ncbi:MAG: TIGR03084 family protein [Alphaproteobacteria bacterium MedPE-SWcel]|nr:MAG: TIGR03084 family protein [Alphaproteobacteria bacterium MedPE-SWcel]
MQQAQDFREEYEGLAAVLDGQPHRIFTTPTQFKGWTVNDVLGHLHFFNAAAEAALAGAEAFDAMLGQAAMDLAAGGQILEMQFPWLDGLSGPALFAEWRIGAERLANAYAAANPKARVKWVGPEMSALSAITARQMETWAHGQEIFDLLGKHREEGDRIRNIAHLGVATFGWSFQVRGQAVPLPPPHVVLTAPSGAIWQWNDPQDDNRVEGSAVEFAQVVTQVRNLADTQLRTTPGTARRWMSQAQCFAGPPVAPPVPGSRFLNPDAPSST